MHRGVWLTSFLLIAGAMAQQSSAPSQPAPQPPPPQVRLNVLNVCTPPEADRKAMAAALAQLPRKPAFAPDFEIARGRSTAPDLPLAEWVRVRHELAADLPISSATYSFSVDPKGMGETLVLLARDSKEFMNVSFEDAISGVDTPTAAMRADTPVTRIKVERLGKASLGLARCPEADQSAYEPLFGAASAIMADYRAVMSVRRIVPAELNRIGSSAPKPAAAKPAGAPKH